MRFHETVRFHETAVATKAVRVVRAHFHVAERFRAAAAKTDAHCAKARTHAAARIRVSAAGRTGAVVRHAMATHYATADQRGLAIHYAPDDPCFGWALGSNAENHRYHVRGCYGLSWNDFRRSPAASGRESVRPVDSQSNAMACRYE